MQSATRLASEIMEDDHIRIGDLVLFRVRTVRNNKSENTTNLTLYLPELPHITVATLTIKSTTSMKVYNQ